MESYLSVPAIEELVRRVGEDPNAEDETNLKALTSAILNHYFAGNGFITIPEHVPKDGYPDSTIFHVKRPVIGQNSNKDHIVAEAISPLALGCPMLDDLPRLRNKVENSFVWFIQDSAIRFSGDSIIFYGDHKYIGGRTQVELLYHPGERLAQYCLHLRDDAEDIHEVLKHIATEAIRSLDVEELVHQRMREIWDSDFGHTGLPGPQWS